MNFLDPLVLTYSSDYGAQVETFVFSIDQKNDGTKVKQRSGHYSLSIDGSEMKMDKVLAITDV